MSLLKAFQIALPYSIAFLFLIILIFVLSVTLLGKGVVGKPVLHMEKLSSGEKITYQRSSSFKVVELGFDMGLFVCFNKNIYRCEPESSQKCHRNTADALVMSQKLVIHMLFWLRQIYPGICEFLISGCQLTLYVNN